MDLSEYQRRAHETSLNTEIRDGFVYPALGLVNEAGEVAGKVKKYYRDMPDASEIGDHFADFEVAMKSELGDVLWYLAEVATQLGLSLDTVARDNLEKLTSRKNRGKIQGSGDHR